MKKIYLFLLAVLAGAAITSCSFTDVSPIDSITDKSYWKNVNDLKLFANGLYGNLFAPTAAADIDSDNIISSSYRPILFDETTLPASGGGWDWSGIRSCNYFLQRYQQVEGNQEEINKYVAEVRFFRGLLYYSKVRAFGDVPWYEKDLQTTDTDELYKPRDKRNFVIGKIIEDMEYAIQWLPTPDKAEKGRLTKDAARTQLARICLYYGTYIKYHGEADSDGISSRGLLEKAVSLTDDVMNTGLYDIVKATDAGAKQMAYDGYPLPYANLFVQEDLSTCKENILCRYYELGVLAEDIGRSVQDYGVGLSKDFIESFLMKDGTPINNPGSGYQGDENQETEIAGRDPRLYNIIDNQHKPYLVTNGVRFQNLVADCTNGFYVTGYPCTKYHSPNSQQSQARSTFYDWFVYRYAEVLLINAEAHAELGTCTQDVLDRTINKLRDRVDMAHLTVNPVADAKPLNYGYPISNLLYEIRRERRIEMIVEDQRTDDLKRWNAMTLLENPKTMFGIRITPSVIEEYAAANITFGGADGRPTAEFEGKTYLYQYPSKDIHDPHRKWTSTDRRWLSPIPTNELALNPNLTQNPGW